MENEEEFHEKYNNEFSKSGIENISIEKSENDDPAVFDKIFIMMKKGKVNPCC